MRVRHVPVGLAGRRGEVPETRADVARRPAAAAAARRRQRVLGTRHSRHTSPAHGTSGARQTARGTRTAQFGKRLPVCGKRHSKYSARGTFGSPVRHTTQFGIRQLSARGTSGARQTAHGTWTAQFGKQLPVCAKRYSKYSARGTFGSPVRHTTQFGIRQLSALGTSGARQTARGTRTAQFGKRLPVCGKRHSEYSEGNDRREISLEPSKTRRSTPQRVATGRTSQRKKSLEDPPVPGNNFIYGRMNAAVDEDRADHITNSLGSPSSAS